MKKIKWLCVLATFVNVLSFGMLNGVSAQETNAYTSDVIVVGGGGAGLVAALSAAEQGSNVILLEKQAIYGGATSMSSGKIPAVNTTEQAEADIEDSVDALMRDINRAGDYTQNQDLLRVAVENATPIKEWLETQGIEWYLETDSIYYGQSTYRIHVAEGSGAGIVSTLEEQVNANDNIIGLKNMEVVGLLTEENRVVGVIVDKNGEQIEFKADNVILATSGFGANEEMIAQYTPSIINAVPNVAVGATGEGIIWGMELGAGTAAMNAYQGYAPISYETHGSLGSAFLDNGGILVNKDGHRFIDEYVGYSPLATAIVNQPESYAYMIWDQSIQELEIPALGGMTEEELISAETPEELAEALGIEEATLVNEMSLYQEGIELGEDYLNRTKLPESFEGPYYAVKVTGDYRHTQGGLTINPETAEVVSPDNNTIENLYGAGGVTEGFSSNGSAAYMAGNGLLQAFVYGRIAGLHAADSMNEVMDNAEFMQQKEELVALSESQGEIIRSEEVYEDGTFVGSADGHGGLLEVEVTIDNGEIVNVTVLSHSETAGISDPALEKLPQTIVEANSANIDTVSGATETSIAIISAVKNALDE